MKELINILKKIEKVLFLIEILLKKEHNFLLKLKINNNVNILDSIIKRKEKLFKKFLILNQEKIFFEKNNSIFKPYINKELSDYKNKINEKCILLRDLNRKNKIIMNKNFYLNQHFLELCVRHKKVISNNYHNDLKI